MGIAGRQAAKVARNGVARGAGSPVDPNLLYRYKDRFRTAVYVTLTTHGDMDFEQCKKVAKVPELRMSAFNEVRDTMVLEGKLMTEEKRRELQKQGKDVEPIKLTQTTVLANGEKETNETVLVHADNRPEGMRIAARDADEAPPRDDVELKALLEEMIIENPAITYEQAQEVMKWPALTAARFELIRSTLKKSGQIASRRLSPDGARIKKNLEERYTLSTLKSLNLEGYSRQTGHYPKVPQLFHNHKRAVLAKKQAEVDAGKVVEVNPVKEAPQTIVQPTPVIPPTPEPPKPDGLTIGLGAAVIKELAAVDMEDIPDSATRKLVKAKVILVLEQLLKDKNVEIKVVLMDDPAVMEVRRYIRS